MRSLRYYIPALLVAVAIAVLSLMENPHVPLVERWGDKVWHTLMYVGLAAMLYGGMLFDRRESRAYCLLACAVSSVYGGLMELAQACLTVTRTGSWGDVAANMVGSAVGCVGIWILFSLCRRRIFTD